jgi:predicted secreted protein
MATAALAAGLYLGTNKIAEMKAPKLSASADMIDTTSLDSSGWKEALAGLKEWTIGSDGNWKFTDTNGQAAVWSAYGAGSTLGVVFRMGAATAPNFSGTALVSKCDVSGDVADKIGVSFELKGTGALTYTAS